LLAYCLPTLSRGAEEALELQGGLTEGAAFYNSVVLELTAVAQEASRIADRREHEREAFKRKAAAPPPPPPPPPPAAGRSQVAAATAFMPSYPGAAPSQYPTAQAYPARAQQAQHAQSAYAPQYQPAQQQPQPQPQPHGGGSAPPQIMCCQCRKVFQVPAGSKIVACPYCSTHNRVP
jgi:LSD1 subclass zinc finger protein